MATIIIPSALRKYTNQHDRLMVHASNVNDVIVKLTSCYPDIKPHLVNVDGKVPPFINIFVDNHDVRNLQHNDTVVRHDSIISIVPAIAGG